MSQPTSRFDWTAWIAEQSGCTPPAPCGRGAGGNGDDMPCECESDTEIVRSAYRLGIEDARKQAIAAIGAEESMGYAESGGLAAACEVLRKLPAPDRALEADLTRSAEAMAREVGDGLVVAVERLKAIAKLLGDGRIDWEPNYPEIQRALRIARGEDV